MRPRKFYFTLMIAVMFFAFAAVARAQDDAPDSAQYARQLSSIDPITRRTAAEALARLAALDQKKLVEGYLLQEKDKRVKLALNWALYRMGKGEMLFPIVRDLDSVRHDQAADYLAQMERPDDLYFFLKQDNTPLKVEARLIEVLGQIGDGESLNQIKPFIDHFDSNIAAAAKTATAQIQQRLAQGQPNEKTRPRVIGKSAPPR
jgi:HEAT repeat protein